MASRYSKPKKKKLSPYTVLGIIILCTVLCGTVTYKRILLSKQSKAYAAKIEKLEEEEKEQERRTEELKEFKEYVETDEYVEEIARDKLGLVHEGEIVFEPEAK
ncbi:MAG: septum formation initiator family protein [Lachnospiraceae bacterium]|nr:septum formation initiator family protein [Lachnospiraceae bacterium]